MVSFCEHAAPVRAGRVCQPATFTFEFSIREYREREEECSCLKPLSIPLKDLNVNMHAEAVERIRHFRTSHKNFFMAQTEEANQSTGTCQFWIDPIKYM